MPFLVLLAAILLLCVLAAALARIVRDRRMTKRPALRAAVCLLGLLALTAYHLPHTYVLPDGVERIYIEYPTEAGFIERVTLTGGDCGPVLESLSGMWVRRSYESAAGYSAYSALNLQCYAPGGASFGVLLRLDAPQESTMNDGRLRLCSAGAVIDRLMELGYVTPELLERARIAPYAAFPPQDAERTAQP